MSKNNQPVTRQELREELKYLVTKNEFHEELKKLVTKNELGALEQKFDTRFRFFKEDIVHTMLDIKDEIMGELKAIREEQTVLSSHHSRILNLEDKVDVLEKIHPHGRHAQI